MHKIVLYFILVLLAMPFINGYCAELTNQQKDCRDKLLDEFINVLGKDSGLIQAQLMLTSMKLAQKVLSRNGLREQSVEAYIQDIVGEKTIARLDARSDIQQQILETYHKYSPSQKYLDAKFDLNSLRSQDIESMNDEQIARYMIQMQTIWQEQDDFGFNENDYAMAWYINKVQLYSSGKPSSYISDTVKLVLKDITNAQSRISENMNKAYLKLKARLQNLKMKVFSQYKEICLNLYDFSDNKISQNDSIFNQIRCENFNEYTFLNDLFQKSIEQILSSLEDPIFSLANSEADLKLGKNLERTPGQIREIQDQINQLDDKEKVIQYFASGLAKDMSHCDGFVIVDKKTSSTSLYTIDGEEIMTAPTILGQGKTKNFKDEEIVFGADSKLRRFDKDGKKIYTNTTGAGVYWVKKNLNPMQRTQRKYDQEYNDRVLVIYSPHKDIIDENGNKIKNTEGIEEEIQAIHGVPNPGWVGNRHARMTSFESPDKAKNLSSGCVNLEAYTYDLINEFVGHKCPVYILPEEEQNYFRVKNGELLFSTSNKLKKNGLETLDDGINTNQYNYTPSDKTIMTSSYNKKNSSSGVLDVVFSELSNLQQHAPKLDNDDFQDFAALTHGLVNDPVSARQTFLELYSATSEYEENLTNEERASFEKATMEQKRKIILDVFNKKYQKELQIEKVLQAARRVEFVF